jgi:hypothetical protein
MDQEDAGMKVKFVLHHRDASFTACTAPELCTEALTCWLARLPP